MASAAVATMAKKEMKKKLFELGCFDWSLEDDSNARLDMRGVAAVPRISKLWLPKSTLKVSFNSKTNVPGVKFNNELITKNTIIEWMNEWSPDEDSCVPKFIIEENFEEGDIRIEFVDGEKASRSAMGSDAEINRNQSSMWLNLGGPSDSERKWTVLHETGHALGFIHEHQHPNYPISDILDESKVISDLESILDCCTDDAKQFYEINFQKLKATDAVDAVTFDRDINSVMMYSIKSDWIKEGVTLNGLIYYGDYLWTTARIEGELTKSDLTCAKRIYEEFSKNFPEIGTDNLASMLKELYSNCGLDAERSSSPIVTGHETFDSSRLLAPILKIAKSCIAGSKQSYSEYQGKEDLFVAQYNHLSEHTKLFESYLRKSKELEVNSAELEAHIEELHRLAGQNDKLKIELAIKEDVLNASYIQLSDQKIRLIRMSKEVARLTKRVEELEKMHPEFDKTKPLGYNDSHVYLGKYGMQPAAIKRIQFTNNKKRLQYELKMLQEASEKSFHIIKCYAFDFDNTQAMLTIIMELCKLDLHCFVMESERRSIWDEFQKKNFNMDILNQLMRGVVHLHSLKIVHRDLKPHNILLQWEKVPELPDDRVLVKIGDFGLSKKANQFGSASVSRQRRASRGWAAHEIYKDVDLVVVSVMVSNVI